MKTRLFLVLIALFMVSNTFSQANLNDYKYVIVPNKFDFLKEKNQYQLNELAQFLFKKYGFNALMEGDGYPEDMALNRCLTLKSDVIKDSGLFKTKLTVELKDCNDRVVYTSEIGESREKEYAKAYNEALRAAFKSFEALNYKYQPKITNTVAVQAVEAKAEVSKEIATLKEEIASLKREKQAEVTETKVATVPVKAIKSVESSAIESVSGVLYAQIIKNGFQLVDSSPKVVYRILKTGLENTFLVENKQAIVYKKGDSWILEYYADGTLKQEGLNIKF
ncbi:hypothetical protein [Snuella sedimenti]|uniref:Secreted protein n=1 Tax=Snuella sedimenti TaxID=2798802 RepID=A0A8J7LLX8_9FLAO|nr:hypothetical protein [Snuella sedimenti]MBJ6366849.1 hypothetical protein [Snuella sedimenti]